MTIDNSIKDIQKKVNDFIIAHGGYWSPISMICAIIEELGELAREVNSLEGYKPKKFNEVESNLEGELADLLFSIICIANYYKVDLNEEFNKIMIKYSKRDSDRFH